MFAANGSNEVLQTLLLTYGGPGRTVATFEPTYPLHGHIARITGTDVVEGERARRLHPRPRRGAAVVLDADPPGRHVPVLAQQPDRARRAGSRSCARCSTVAPGLVVVDEAYGQFADWSALTLVDEDAPLVVTRTYSKMWSMAAARLGYLVGPAWLVAELDKVVLPYHLDAAKQIAGRLALRFADEMDARVERSSRSASGIVGGARRARRSTCVPSGANFVLFRPAATAPAGHGVAGAARPRRARARLLGLAAARGLPAGHGRHPERERRVPRRARRGACR